MYKCIVILTVIMVLLSVIVFGYFLDPELSSYIFNQIGRNLSSGGGDGNMNSLSSYHNNHYASLPKVQPTQYDYNVELSQLYTGGDEIIRVSRQEVCQHCHGRGSHPDHKPHQCHTCGGSGILTYLTNMGHFQQRIQKTCNVCAGKFIILLYV